MTRYIISFALFMALSLVSEAQHNYIAHQGKIDFEFKINRFERARKLLGVKASSTKYRDYILSLQNDRFLTRSYQLDFDKKQSSYQLKDYEATPDFVDLLIGIPAVNMFRELETDSMSINRQYGEERFLIVEKSKAIKWKYTDERMDILGYECRRANGLLMDSIYVVAFYCPEIDVSAGPSIFEGLPGMILGVSIPEDHVNIFATKIELNGRSEIKKGKVEKKSKQMTFSEFEAFLKDILGDRFDMDQWNYNMRGIKF